MRCSHGLADHLSHTSGWLQARSLFLWHYIILNILMNAIKRLCFRQGLWSSSERAGNVVCSYPTCKVNQVWQQFIKLWYFWNRAMDGDMHALQTRCGQSNLLLCCYRAYLQSGTCWEEATEPLEMGVCPWLVSLSKGNPRITSLLKLQLKEMTLSNLI